MTAMDYLEYLITTKNTEGDLHTIPVQLSELQTLRALMKGEQLLREQLDRETYK